MVAERRRDATVVVVDWPQSVVVFSSCLPSNPPHVSTTLSDDDDFCFWKTIILSRALVFGLLRAVMVPRTDADASTDDDKEEEDDDDDANIL